MSNLGSLVVSLEANIARFTSDMGRAAAIAEQRMAQIDRSLGIVKTSLKALGGGLAIGLTLDKVRDKIEGAIASAAGLQQLAEHTGAAVENLSALAAVAKLSGTDTEALAGGLQKLAKAMNDAAHGGVKNTEAFKAIGISVDDLKGKNPDEIFLLIARRLEQYGDGAGKVALSQQLLGKSGANLLPVMKDLALVGEYQVKVTAEQARVADEYEKNLVRLDAAQNAILKRIGMELVPVLNNFTEAMLDSLKASNGLKAGVDALADEKSITNFAQDAAIAMAVLIGALEGAARGTYALAKSFQVVYADSKFALQFLNATPGQAYDLIANGTGPLQKALNERNAVLTSANAAYDKAWNFDSRALERNLQARFELANAGGGAGRGSANDPRRLDARKPGVNFNPNAGAGGSGAAGTTDDPTRKRLEGRIREQEAFIAAEKSQLTTRERYLQAFYPAEYLSASDYYATRQSLIQDALAAEIEAYDREAAAVAVYLAGADTEVKRQDARNKLADVAVRRKTAETEADEKLTDTVLEQARAYREFDLATTALARQYELANDQQRLEIDLMGKGTLEALKTVEARRIQLELDNRLYAIKRRGLDESAMQVEIDRAIEESNAATASSLALIEERYNKQRDAAFGAHEAFRKYAEDAGHMGTQVEGTMTHALSGMEDALVTFVTTGKLSFTSLANSIVADITRIIVKQQISNALGIAGGAGGAGGIGGAGSSWLGTVVGSLFGTAGTAAMANVMPGNSLDNFLSLNNNFASVAMPSFAVGTDYVPFDMVARIHEGERIVPSALNRSGAWDGQAEQSIVVNVTAPANADRASATQWGAEVGRQIQRAVARGT